MLIVQRLSGVHNTSVCSSRQSVHIRRSGASPGHAAASQNLGTAMPPQPAADRPAMPGRRRCDARSLPVTGRPEPQRQALGDAPCSDAQHARLARVHYMLHQGPSLHRPETKVAIKPIVTPDLLPSVQPGSEAAHCTRRFCSPNASRADAGATGLQCSEVGRAASHVPAGAAALTACAPAGLVSRCAHKTDAIDNEASAGPPSWQVCLRRELLRGPQG